MSKKIICIIFVIIIITISAFAAAPNVTDGADIDSDMSDYPSYPSSNVVTPDVQYIPPVYVGPAYPNSVISTIGDLWDNLKTILNRLDSNLTNLPSIGSYLLNIKTYLQINSSNGNTIGNRINDINDNIYYAYNGPLKGVFNMLSSTNGQNGGYYYRIFKWLYNPDTGTGFFPNLASSLGSIEGKVQNSYLALSDIDTDTGLIQSDVRGIYNMFASGISGGSAYYNQLIGSNGAIEHIETYTNNTAAGVGSIIADLTSIDSNLSSLKTKFDVNGMVYEEILDISGNTNRIRDIYSGYGFDSNSTLADTLDDINGQEDTQIGLLEDIVDVLANQQDVTIVDNQTTNKNTVIPIFFSPTVNNNTSLESSDFTNLGGIVRAIRNLLNTGVSLAGFSAALNEAADEGLEFFQQSTVNDMYNSNYLGAY